MDLNNKAARAQSISGGVSSITISHEAGLMENLFVENASGPWTTALLVVTNNRCTILPRPAGEGRGEGESSERECPVAMARPTCHSAGPSCAFFFFSFFLKGFVRHCVSISGGNANTPSLAVTMQLVRPNRMVTAQMARKDIYSVEEWGALAKQARYDPVHLARLLNVCPRQLNRYTHKLFNNSLQEWLDELRLADAAAMLLQSDELIKAIAYDLGFKDVSHFSHKFKARYGVSPKAHKDRKTS